MPLPNRTFLSYSHDSPSHRQRVLELANQLRADGVDCWIDRFDPAPADGWPRWMQQQLEQASFVMLVCTETYRRRFDGQEETGKGLGVNWEGNLISNALYHQRKGTTFLPILFEGDSDDVVPGPLKQFTHFTLPRQYEELYRLVTGQPEAIPAPVGPVKPMPPFSAMANLPIPTVRSDGTANPYDPWTPARPPRFVGRQRELHRLQAALDGGLSVNLVGDWRIGKTSLLEAWSERAVNSGRVVKLLSGERSEGAGISAFVETITGGPAPLDSEGAADQLSDWAASVGKPGLLPLVLVDEFDALAERLEHRFLERVRGMLDRVQWVFGSRRELDELYQILGRTSPFYNRLQLLWLGLLHEDDAEQLVSEMNAPLTDEDRDEMRRWSGRHPFFLQLFGYHFAHARLAGSSLAAARDDFYMEASQKLRDLWRSLPEPQRQSLIGITRGVTVNSASLRSRGLVTDDGRLFGFVLTEWMREQQ